MNTKSLQVSFDRIGTTLDKKYGSKYKELLKIWNIKKKGHNSFPGEFMGFTKDSYYPGFGLFHSITKYEDAEGRKIILLYDPEASYLPKLCVFFFPTVKSHFNYDLIAGVHAALGFHVADFKLSVLEIALDNFSKRKYANHLWLNSKRGGFSAGRKHFEIDYLKIMDDLENYQKINGTRSYKQFNSYEKSECGLKFERNELILRRGYLSSIGINTLEDLNKKDAVEKICGSLGLYKFDKKTFERKNGEIGWMKGSSNNYNLKYSAERLHAEYRKNCVEKIVEKYKGWVKVGELKNASKSIPNFKRDFLKEIRDAGTMRKGIRAQIKRFFLIMK